MLAVMLSILLAACGGSGGGDDTPSAASVDVAATSTRDTELGGLATATREAELTELAAARSTEVVAAPEPTPTPRPRATATPAGMTEAAYLAWLDNMTEEMGDSLRRFTDLLDNPTFFDAAWKRDIRNETLLWASAYREAQRIDAPERYTKVQLNVERGLERLDAAGDDFNLGVETVDNSLINSATRKMEEGTGYIKEALRLMEAMS